MERECGMWRGGKKKHRLVYGKTDTGNILRKTPKASPAEADFLFEIDPEPAAERLTSYGGTPLLIRTLRSLEVGQSVEVWERSLIFRARMRPCADWGK